MYTATQLSGEFNVSRHTIYHWTRMGALAPAIGKGRTAYYTDHHVRQIRAIKRSLEANKSLTDLAVIHGNRA